MKTYSEQEIMDILKAKIKEFGTQKAFAESLDLSPQYISDVMKLRRPVNPLVKRIGYEMVFVKRKGDKQNG